MDGHAGLPTVCYRLREAWTLNFHWDFTWFAFLQGMEMFGSLVLAAGRFVSVLSAVFAIIYSCSIYFYHSYFGWFSSGGKQDGAEYRLR